jgi:integrase
MALKHVTRIVVSGGYKGHTIHRLVDDEGQYIEGFDRFSQKLVDDGYAFETRKRYQEAGARFIDYLFEVGVLGATTTNFEINQAINTYPIFLRDGPNVQDVDPHKADALQRYAQAIGMKKGLSGKSFAPSLAAVNILLHVAQDLANEAAATLKSHGMSSSPDDAQVLIGAIDGFTTLSSFQKRRLKQNSMLGSVMRLHGEIKRPRKLKSPVKREKQKDLDRFDFPLTRFPDLIRAATCYRDKALWCLQGASGIRGHEAVGLRFIHVDPVNREVYVEDPDYARFGRQMTRDEKHRFKGRVVSRTYLFEPLKSEFFKWLELYLRHEYVPTSEHDYVFQIISGKDRGKPLKDASDSARIKSFKKAVKRAGIDGPSMMPDYVWTPHSLRHMYGIYMLNYMPVPGGFGLILTEVQMLMGHKDIESTRHYARQDAVILKAKLEAADHMIFDGGFDLDSFPDLIAKRLMAEAEKYKQLKRRRDDQQDRQAGARQSGHKRRQA